MSLKEKKNITCENLNRNLIRTNLIKITITEQSSDRIVKN